MTPTIKGYPVAEPERPQNFTLVVLVLIVLAKGGASKITVALASVELSNLTQLG